MNTAMRTKSEPNGEVEERVIGAVSAYMFGEHKSEADRDEKYQQLHEVMFANIIKANDAFLLLAIAIEKVNAKNIARNERISALEARLAELEREPRGLKYFGTWQRAVPYARHAAVTHQGSVWACIVDKTCGEIPGDGSTAWQLAVKCGRDGRDLR